MKIKMVLKQIALIGLALAVASCGGSLLETPPGTLSIIVSSIATSAAETTVDISWTTNVATTHMVEYGTAPGSYTQATFQTETADAAHAVTLTGLTEATTYYYRVRNFHSSLPDVASAESAFTTSVSTPPSLAQKQRGIWIVGGLSGNAIGTTVSQVDLYDPVLDTWYASVTSLPTPVSFAGVCSRGGRIYVIGGFNSTGTVMANVQIYNVAGDSWSAGGAMSAPPPVSARANINAVTVNDKIYVLGGTTGDAALPRAGSITTFEYNPVLDSWSSKANFVAAGQYSERLSLPFNDVIYNMGGRTSATAVTNTHDGLAVTTNGLTQATEVLLTAARTGATGVIYTPTAGPAVAAIVGGFTSLTLTSGNFIVQGTTVSPATNLFQYLYFPFTNPPVTLGWQNADPLDIDLGFCAAALSGSDLYVFGGTASCVSASASGLNNAYRFDLDTVATGGAWTASASMPVGRYGHAAVVVQ